MIDHISPIIGIPAALLAWALLALLTFADRRKARQLPKGITIMSAWGGRHAQGMVAATLAAYGTRCHLCLKHGATSADHIIPRSHGGDDSLDNLRPAHPLCNSRRGDRTIAWFRARYCPELVAEATVAEATAFFGTAASGHPAPAPSIFSRPKQTGTAQTQPIDLGFFGLQEAS